MGNKTPLPCAICGLAPQIRIRPEAKDRFCMFYGIRITADEANDPCSTLRQHCLQDGNHFTWPVQGFGPNDLLAWHRVHLDWHFKRKAIRITIYTGVASVLLGTLGLFVSLITN